MNKNGKPENLTPFKPGQSGNPGGHPKKRPLSDLYLALLEEPFDEAELRAKRKLPRGATWGEAIARGVALAAINGKMGAAREIREAIEGKATQRIEFGDTTLMDAFEKMNEAELEAYASEGKLPDWFPVSGDGTSGPRKLGDELRVQNC